MQGLSEKQPAWTAANAIIQFAAMKTHTLKRTRNTGTVRDIGETADKINCRHKKGRPFKGKKRTPFLQKFSACEDFTKSRIQTKAPDGQNPRVLFGYRFGLKLKQSGRYKTSDNPFPERSKGWGDRAPADALRFGGAERRHPPPHYGAFF